MLPNHSEATVTISFAGVALFCINKDKQNRCEVGIVHCDRHQTVMDIQEIVFDNSGDPIKSMLTTPPASPFLGSDILIKVVNQNAPITAAGIEPFSESPVFNRVQGIGDQNDFRWIVDLEGEELHDRQLDLLPTTFSSAPRLSPKIFISEGVIYTELATDERLALMSDGVQGNEFGPVAIKIGVDLFLEDGGELQMWGKRGPITTQLATLKKKANTKYHINVENLCTVEGDAPGTDFSLFYDIVHDPTNSRFDFRRIVENLGQGNPKDYLTANPLFSLDNNPLICVGALLGRTQTIADHDFNM